MESIWFTRLFILLAGKVDQGLKGKLSGMAMQPHQPCNVAVGVIHWLVRTCYNLFQAIFVFCHRAYWKALQPAFWFNFSMKCCATTEILPSTEQGQTSSIAFFSLLSYITIKAIHQERTNTSFIKHSCHHSAGEVLPIVYCTWEFNQSTKTEISSRNWNIFIGETLYFFLASFSYDRIITSIP